MTRVVIIEDEVMIADSLEAILRAVEPALLVEAKLKSVADSIDYFESNNTPDVIFSDIELLDGKSFEIFRTVTLDCPVIFCTAFDEFALEAFDANGIDYIMKPFSKDRISKALAKLRTLTGQKNEGMISNMEHLLEYMQMQRTGSLLVEKGEKIIPLSYKSIALVILQHGILYVYTETGERYRSNSTLEKLQSLLGPRFYRLNRQCLIQRNAIVHVSNHYSRKLKVRPTVSDLEDIVVSKAGARPFLDWLEETN